MGALFIDLWTVLAPKDATSVPAPPALPSYGSLLLKTVIALVIVIALAWVLLRWVLPRFLPGTMSRGRVIRVVARQALESRRSVVLVDVCGRFLVLGLSEQSVSLLAEMSTDEVERALAEEAAQSPPTRSFAEVFRGVLGKRAEETPEEGEGDAKKGDDA